MTADARPLTPAEAGAIDDTQDAQPSILFEEAMAHANDRLSFVPGDRVTVGFAPAMHDGWPVDGHAPKKLPAGRATGRDMAVATQGSRWATLGAGEPSTSPARSSAPEASAPQAGSSAESGSPAEPATTAEPSPSSATDPRRAGADATPTERDASRAPTARRRRRSMTPRTPPPPRPRGSTTSLDPDGSLAPSAAAGLRRQVLGFLPYWELSGAASSLRYDVLSTIAYFSVGADKAGNLAKRDSSGNLTTGWAGWTSADMTRVINAAHAAHTRVVLTVSVFAWTTNNAAIQKAILGSSTARSNLARQIAAAVRDRGADGVNLDFEPLASGYEAEFVALLRVRPERAQQRRVRLPAHVRHDRLPGQLPAGVLGRRRRRGRDLHHGLRLPHGELELRGLDRPVGRPGLRPRGHRAFLRQPRVAVPPHPGRAVVRPCLVDRVGERQRAYPDRREVRLFGVGRTTTPPSASRPSTGADGTVARLSPGSRTSARTAPARMAA